MLVSMCAQQLYAQSLGYDISLVVYPDFPKPGETVRVSADSSDINLDFRTLSWSVNGKQIASGPAVTSVEFTLGNVTQTYTVTVSISDGENPILMSKTITPGRLIMLWEAVDSFVPFGYLGKPLMPAEGTVRVTAIPIGASTLDKLFFLWKNGNQNLPAQSGFGKNSIIVQNNVLVDSMNISVSASAPDGSFNANEHILINRAKPDVRVWSPSTFGASSYEKNSTLVISGQSGLVRAAPYYMSTRSGLSELSYIWKVGQTEQVFTEGDNEYELLLGGPKSIDLTLIVQSIKSLLQDTTVVKSINFISP